ncbi:MAG: adenine nucleotide alpha hydrolase [Dehalococcoidia bacterium]|nr:adenine nucleotide alpha hydrolase [Dehalococcoidia bacterium]MDW8119185.1 ATP-binding protein [Chloroflexota bacterium]
MVEKVIMSWSGGKDSTLALYYLLRDPRYRVVGLLTTFTQGYERVSMSGIRFPLLQAQAQAIGLPLRPVWIPQDASNDTYEGAMRQALNTLTQEGVRIAAFGDLFLEDVRAYRERMLDQIGWHALFPLWKRPTPLVAQEVLSLGFKAIVVCVDTQVLPPSFAGREFDQNLLADLPPGVDPCGENGEFHTFVYQGPLFRHPVLFTPGQRVVRGRWAYCDLVPEQAPTG